MNVILTFVVYYALVIAFFAPVAKVHLEHPAWRNSPVDLLFIVITLIVSFLMALPIMAFK